MPRKTRKEKFATQTYKYKQSQTVSMGTPEKVSPKKTLFPTNDSTREYFMQDLRKSVIVVSSIILLQFALYILNMSGMLTNVNF